MRKPRRIRYESTPTFAFVVDGETEIWYLQMLLRNERSIRMSIKPEIPNKKSLEEQFNLVRDLANREYSKVFWIVDLDTIIKESREAPRGEKRPINIFIDYKNQLERDFDNVIIIVNNPCLEYWFLLHFVNTTKLFDTCSKAESQLKTHLKDYQKTRRYFTKQDNDIYLKLKPYLSAAIQRANSMGKFDPEKPLKAICEMGILFGSEELRKQNF